MKALLLSVFAVCTLTGCITFSLGYTTERGTTISASSNGRTVTLGADRAQVIGGRGEIKDPGFGAAATFDLPKRLPKTEGLKK